MYDGSQFAWMFFHPRIDGEIAPDNAVESRQASSSLRFLAFEIRANVAPLREDDVFLPATPTPIILRYAQNKVDKPR
jgi:hypothetical protein